jgi:hypothetical protein
MLLRICVFMLCYLASVVYVLFKMYRFIQGYMSFGVTPAIQIVTRNAFRCLQHSK